MQSCPSRLHRFPAPLALALATLVMAGTLTGGCDSSSTPGSGEGSSGGALIPLQSGNTWETSSGAFFRVTGEEATYEGESYVAVQSDGAGALIYLREENGDVIVRAAENEAGLLNFRLRYPVSDGDAYSYTDAEGNTFSVEVDERDVSVPAGSFDGCVCYNITSESGYLNDACFAPGVGPVQYNGGFGEYQLAAYDVN